MEVYHLNQTVECLSGPPREQVIVQNFWAATALGKFHQDSKAEIEFNIQGERKKAILEWNSDFPKYAMREDKDIANQGGIALAWFVMSVLLKYSHVEQTHIGDGVDYLFKVDEPNDDDLNFLGDYHFVEVSGILQESGTNTLANRIKEKHKQIERGGMREKPSSVIVTLFSEPRTVKEIHK